MTVTANALGVVTGRFTIPANVLAGSKAVSFVGAGGSRGDAVFVGQGTRNEQVWQQVRQLTYITVSVDPLAQTFTPTETIQLSGIDLRFRVRGAKPVRVQIRATEVGFPNSTILAEGRIAAADIVLNGTTRVDFDWPCIVQANTEYAFAVLTDDANTALGIAELSKFDTYSQTWVTQQPYQVGVLLSSSNNSTWTAHQDKDLWFRLVSCVYASGATRTINLGNVPVVGATDLVMLGATETPAAGAVVDYNLTLPDGTLVMASDSQVVSLTAPITGNVGVQAVVRTAAGVSGILHPGTAIAAGTIATSADYYSRAIPATGAVKLIVVYEAIIPSGAAVLVEWAASGSSSWATVTATSNVAIDNGYREFLCTVATGVTAASIRIRVTMTGTAAARPRVKNLQALRT